MILLPRMADPPDGLVFHLGHTWAQRGRQEAAVGIDGFAARLLPPATAVELPRPGRLLHQGDPAFRVTAGDRSARFLCPVTGRVAAVNESLLAEPDQLRQEPYGRGWVLRIRAEHLVADQVNLLSGQLAERWLEASLEDLRMRVAGLAGSVIQPSGEGGASFLACLPPRNWEELASELLHSAA